MADTAETLISNAVAQGYDSLSDRQLKECLLLAAQSGGDGSLWTNVDGTITSNSAVADGASAVAFRMNSSNTLSTSGSALLTLQNNNTNQLKVNYNGGIDIGVGAAEAGEGFGFSALNYNELATRLLLEAAADSEFSTDYKFLVSITPDTKRVLVDSYAYDGTDFSQLEIDLGVNTALKLSLIDQDRTQFKADPSAEAATVAYIFDTISTHTSGNLVEVKNNGTLKFSVDFAGSIQVTSNAPASAAAAGVAGTITWDSSFIYVCVSTNSWKRVAIAAW